MLCPLPVPLDCLGQLSLNLIQLVAFCIQTDRGARWALWTVVCAGASGLPAALAVVPTSSLLLLQPFIPFHNMCTAVYVNWTFCQPFCVTDSFYLFIHFLIENAQASSFMKEHRQGNLGSAPLILYLPNCLKRSRVTSVTDAASPQENCPSAVL